MYYTAYLKNTIIGCLTVVLDREKIGDIEIEQSIRSSHDMALWLSIMRRGYDAFGLDINLAKYRVLLNSNSSSKIKPLKMFGEYTEVLKSLILLIVYGVSLIMQ